jgi:hypothetical protein
MDDGINDTARKTMPAPTTAQHSSVAREASLIAGVDGSAEETRSVHRMNAEPASISSPEKNHALKADHVRGDLCCLV